METLHTITPTPTTTFTMTRALVALTLAVFATASLAKGSARAEALEMDDKDRATLSKETLKQSRMGQGKANGLKSGQSQQGCGNVDIGNSDGDKKGSQRIAERNRTVIVTGNVYNTAQCR